MPLNETLKGKTYQEFTFEVERDRVTQFAVAVGEDDPRFLEAGAAQAEGFPEQLAFPTFPTVLGILVSAQVVADQELGLDYTRVVHGEQEYEWKRPIVVGDVLKATPRIGDIYSKGPNELLVIEAEMTDADGEVVCISRGTLLSRGTAEGA
jgi:acyl dehydratase